MNLARATATTLAIAFLILPDIGAGREQKPVWEVGAGIGLLRLPDYRGSDEGRFYALPYPSIIYRGDIFKVDRDTIYGRIFGTDRVLLDISYYGSVPVDSDDNAARRGMPDLDATFETGPALDIRLYENPESRSALRLILPVRPVFSTDFSSVTYEGVLFSPRLNFKQDDAIANTGIGISLSAGPIFADSGFHDYYYTVDPAYATPDRPAYDAGGGYSGSSITLTLSKRYKGFNISVFASADVLEGAVFEDSPLVRTTTSIISGISISRVFFRSSKTAPVDRLDKIDGRAE